MTLSDFPFCEGIFRIRTIPCFFTGDGNRLKHTLVHIFFCHTFLALVTPDDCFGTHQVWFAHHWIVCAEDGWVPVIE